ncbi:MULTISPECIES: glutamate synthase [Pseudonocardia]|uniref:GXGXG motif protein n=2 Tax=Pseudonocardia TaxID=1847 RepID=A0A1Y2MRX7_PSEAH|nr:MULTISPECIES: glutamate synthase [Pseudonocardia]OSY37729.1 GXGXG motif protein [Pseudonocardia autotrophica]TDN75781.1 N-methylglutamate synthase subunit B [Pseudonocardia autotrophica]BBF99752.1 protein glxC [Pseudonocardia autotrophica]GEC27106.1 protein glxC [Pseudonocardia saturnea]
MAALSNHPDDTASPQDSARDGAGVHTVDLTTATVRTLNAELHAPTARRYRVLSPRGAHAVAVGVDDELDIHVEGDVGYYCGGMNQGGTIVVDGSAGPGLAENMMSGTVRVRGDASQSAGATARGGLLVVEGTASMRCGISMKGVDIVVGGDVGPMSAFMAQAGRLVVCGDAGDGLGDSIYEARLYVRGKVGALGADCIEKEIRDEHRSELAELLTAAGMTDLAGDPAALAEFRRFGSARRLYHFTSERSGSY